LFSSINNLAQFFLKSTALPIEPGGQLKLLIMFASPLERVSGIVIDQRISDGETIFKW
jgi:hypothetical protein